MGRSRGACPTQPRIRSAPAPVADDTMPKNFRQALSALTQRIFDQPGAKEYDRVLMALAAAPSRETTS